MSGSLLAKRADWIELIEAIHTRKPGVESWSSQVLDLVRTAPRPGRGKTSYDVLENEPRSVVLHALTPGEVAVLSAAARGLPTKLVGYALGLSPSVVSTRLASAAAKLGTASRTELVRVAALLTNDRRARASDAALTAAEEEILALLHQGLSNKEIAAQRSRSVRTIANQVASLLRKTGHGSRRALVAGTA